MKSLKRVMKRNVLLNNILYNVKLKIKSDINHYKIMEKMGN